MKNKLTFLSLLTVFGCQTVGADVSIPAYFSEYNKSTSFFMDAVKTDKPEAFSSMYKSKWYFDADLKNQEGDVVKVSTCTDLVANLQNGYTSLNDYEYGYVYASNHICESWSELSKLSSAKKSFLADLSFNESFAKNVPPQLALVISNETEERLATAVSWDDMFSIERVEELNEEQAIFYSEGSIQKLTLMAKGDYNGDGIEDLLLYMENSVEGGSYSSVHAYVLTRLSESAPYTLLKQW
ncbi:hypothetical protein [Agarivorans sp. 1_MG-2023]|uniref:hypothetical protein n=1 Tax=Agarivorans sp. 1_MG-2023 TaxID=3062634 RepID=UPI0026E29A2B|nr:hypothetical protein [Agarivorans sp. 1_MG-2023]MDO6764915.1 hypothetical protein [Agarivorans sp. 1_MG-2023]